MNSLSQALACNDSVHLLFAHGVYRVDGRAVNPSDPIHAGAIRWVRQLAQVLPADLIALEALVPPHASGKLDHQRLRSHLVNGPATLRRFAPLWIDGNDVKARAAATLVVPVSMGPAVVVSTSVEVRAADRAPLAIDNVTIAAATGAIDDAVSVALLGEAAWVLASGIHGLVLEFCVRRPDSPPPCSLPPQAARSPSLLVT